MSSVYIAYSYHQILEYYGIGDLIWDRYEFWINLLFALLSPVALIALALRRSAGRWTAIAIFVINVVANLVNAGIVRGTVRDEIDLITEVAGIAFVDLPLLYLCFHLIRSPTVNAFLGKPGGDTLTSGIATPPPPPTFDT